MSLLLLYLYAVLGGKKSRAIATEEILISAEIEVMVTYASLVEYRIITRHT